MKQISFPRNEWADIQNRLNKNLSVYTIRVSAEYGCYIVGDILQTEWGGVVEVVSVKKVTGGLAGLKDNYEFYSELTEEMINELTPYKEMEIIVLKNHKND